MNKPTAKHYGVIGSDSVIRAYPAEVTEVYITHLEQRAEAEEEKLAELEKQEPVAYLTWHQGFRSPDDCEDYLVVASNGDKSCDGSQAFPVFTRPAPAINLAELVPDYLVDAMCNLNLPGVSIGDKAIIGKSIEVLRNIEAAK